MSTSRSADPSPTRRLVATLTPSVLVAALSTSAFAADLLVPQQFTTIQAAIKQAAPGDRIVVAYTSPNQEVIEANVPGLTIEATVSDLELAHSLISANDVTIRGFEINSLDVHLDPRRHGAVGVRGKQRPQRDHPATMT